MFTLSCRASTTYPHLACLSSSLICTSTGSPCNICIPCDVTKGQYSLPVRVSAQFHRETQLLVIRSYQSKVLRSGVRILLTQETVAPQHKVQKEAKKKSLQ